MAIEQRFGGDWTEVKLGCLEDYLRAHRSIFRGNERASFFTTWFVDAFAGTGSRAESGASPAAPLFDDVYSDSDTVTYREGSARIALGLPDPFDKYFFIEKSGKKLDALNEQVKKDHASLVSRCTFSAGDANSALRDWCRNRNWKRERAVVFLDPYGMQVEWTTIEHLAATKGIDLWYLFPLGVGVSRLLTRDGKIDESWQTRLDLLLGTKGWRERFYRAGIQQSLFKEVEESVERHATPESIATFIEERLKSCFEGVAKGLVLRNSRSNPMYLLCFAAANKRGAPTALKIAQHILGA
jgi:three-Cys-motif partner protein